MKKEYINAVELGNVIVEVVHPSLDKIVAIISSLNYTVNSATQELIVEGIDLTEFYLDGKNVSGDLISLRQNLISYIENNKSKVTKFSKHFPYVVYS